jgi:hypothetical protein
VVWFQTSFDSSEFLCSFSIIPNQNKWPPLVIKPCIDAEEISVNGRRPIVKTSTHSINKRHGSLGRGDKTVSSRKIHTQSDREGT